MIVRFYATLRAAVGAREVDLPLPPGARAIDLARAIAERWPDLADRVLDPGGGLSRQVHILVDGRNTRWLPEGADTVLPRDARIDVFPPAAGG